MALLEYVDPEVDDLRLRRLFDADVDVYGHPSLFARLLAHNPSVLEARQRYVCDLLEEGTLDATEAELAYVAVAAANECSYCAASHSQRLVEHVGISREAVDAIFEGEEAPFDERERAIVDFARSVATDPKRVGEDHLDRLRDLGFADADLVALVATVAAGVAANVIVDTFNVLPQDGEGLERYES